MKSLFRFILFSLALMFFTGLWAQDPSSTTSTKDGVQFFEGTWEEAVAEAEKEKKLLMIDAYTEWCHWCKVMDKKTFSDSEVGNFFQENIIAYKMDMEKGKGMLMAMKYRVGSFPTFLFFAADGPLIARVNGYREPTSFLEILREDVMNPEKQVRHPGDPKVLDPGFPEFYKLSYKTGKERKMPAQDEVMGFLDQQEDLFNEVSWGVMSRFSFPGKYKDHFINNYDTYKASYGDETEMLFERMVYRMVLQAAKEKNEELLNEAAELSSSKFQDKDPESLRLTYQLVYDQRTQDWAAYGQHVSELMGMDLSISNGQINSYAWNIYLHVEDPELSREAASWMERVIEEEPDYMYIDTYAAVLYKAGELKKAEKFAKKAIEIGKKEGEDVSETEELLKKIKDK